MKTVPAVLLALASVTALSATPTEFWAQVSRVDSMRQVMDSARAGALARRLTTRAPVVIRTLTDSVITRTLAVLDARAAGNDSAVLRTIAESRLNLLDIEAVVTDIVLATTGAALERAARHFGSSPDSVYLGATDSIRIRRADLTRMQQEHAQAVQRAYAARGGVEQFQRNRDILTRHDGLIRRVRALAAASTRQRGVRVDTPPER